MSKMQVTYEFHEAANLFPLDDEHIDELAADIKAHGLHCPIEIFEDRIVDGRRRYMACRIAGVTPDFVEVSPADPIAYVLSLNLHRRHLNESQCSMVGARAREYYDKAAKERQKQHGGTAPGKAKNTSGQQSISDTARDAAGRAVGVSGRSIDRASIVLEKGSKQLQRAVDEGLVSVSKAAAIAKAVPKAEQMKAVEEGLPIEVRSPATECEIPDDAIVSSHYSCPTCGQKWPEGRPVYGKG